MLTEKEVLANRLYGDDAKEVLKFLAEVAPDKHQFRNEETFLNFLGRKLQPILKKKALNDKNKKEFWENRAISVDISSTINKKKNVLWCIRLVSENS